MVSFWEMDMETRVQILNEIVCIYLSANTPKGVWNPSFLLGYG